MKKVRISIGIAALWLAACALQAQTVPSNMGPTAATMPPALQNVGFEPRLNSSNDDCIARILEAIHH